MTSVLVVGTAGAAREMLEADLKEVGAHVVGAVDCKQLVQESSRLNPDAVAIICTTPTPELFAATDLLESVHPVPVLALTEDPSVESIERAMASGIHAWVVRGYGANRLRALLQIARLRFAREKQQRDAIADLSRRLEERKLIDRAKGILMDSAQMPEEQAFRTLRTAAMHGKQRLGQVAQRLIDAARSAEAINRSGQLRMLSQRLVKLWLLAQCGIEPRSAEALLAASVKRVEQNLATLGELVSMPTLGDLYDAVLAAWQVLRDTLEGAQGPCGPRALDEVAERLLEAAERLTSALEAASPVARMQLVNTAGRQRMLTQRVAKLALLRVLEPDVDTQLLNARIGLARSEFEDAMELLRDSVLTSALGRGNLDLATQVWGQLRSGCARAERPEGRLSLAQASEELLEIFDQLTSQYEHNLQVLVG
ncbi:MAG TPA: type IV pili methyl-accepting chemotaxis transducer N-terminal domain-containing protein [Burkholderiaceae bacterium]|nr:type IV pili methyl-accepting chemotaxis transducer N-terminal domain-containing protein [Burkholderiaceae bacterium]